MFHMTRYHTARHGLVSWTASGLFSTVSIIALVLGLAVPALLSGPVRPVQAAEPTQPLNIAPASVMVSPNGLFYLSWSSYETDRTSSLAWGDYDSDGNLDLAVGNDNQPTRIYRNEGQQGAEAQMVLVWSSVETGNASSLAWGDYDGDGDLDLVVGNYGQPIRIYRNDGATGGVPAMILVWSSAEVDNVASIAWADYNGDGRLDLAVGNSCTRFPINCSHNRLYRNDGVVGGVLQMAVAWSSVESDNTYAIAWGDYDGDGKLDLAVGNNGQPNRLYRNTGSTLTPNAIWSSAESDNTTSTAWGDYDGDGRLDLAVGNYGQPNRLYRNINGSLAASATWSSVETDNTTSLAWGDYDGDGKLDLAVGNYGQPSRLYRNTGSTLASSAMWSSVEVNNTTNIAWGDYDGDGKLDLAVGNYSQPNRLYRNDGSALMPTAIWTSAESDNTYSLAWGDYDGDGRLDLAVGNYGQPIRLYHNDGVAGGTPHMILVWSSAEADNTTNLAWGDYDGDGRLDLAIGNYGQRNRVYRNNGVVGGVPQMLLAWSSVEMDNTNAVAWGDYDGDGKLDLAVGNYGQPNRLYHNDSGVLSPSASWSLAGADNTTSIAWGDYDGDGKLDLAVGNYGQPNQLYHNDNGTLSASAIWTSAESDNTTSLAWGDYDGDGKLDLAVGNYGQPKRLYHNMGGMLAAGAVWSSAEADNTCALIWGDHDNDGDLDLVVGNWGQPNRLYRNDGGTLTRNAIWSSTEVASSKSIAWGDYDNDGDFDLAVGNAGQPNRLYRNSRDASSGPGAIPIVSITRPGPNADFYSVSRIQAGPTLTMTYTVSHPQADSIKVIRAYYSPDGGGHWLPAIATTNTITTNLVTTGTYTYHWNVLGDSFFGQSDNVVFRLLAIPDVAPRANKAPGPFLHGVYAGVTFPFRVRGTQVRVMSGTVPAANANVYRLPAGQSARAQPIADEAGNPFHTDGQGYLQGRGQIALGDKLIALVPISATAEYQLYYTSAAPTPTGMDAYTVTANGVQTLTVSANKPLALFNLSVSLEWDARQDTAYLNQLEFDLQRVSEVLFDITNGQAALGSVTIYHNREQWNDAHIRIFANNQLRPFASQGGIVTIPVTDPITSTIVYFPGQSYMGATWNRYGNAGISLGEDWPRTLAHELGHYLLYLEDNYLGLDVQGQLIPVTTCAGSIMSDPYRDDYSELHGPANWLQECGHTLSNRLTGRFDWQTVDTFYPALNITSNPGPSSLPLQVTLVKFVEPVTPTLTLPDPRFYLIASDGAAIQPDDHAQAYLFRNNLLIDLGRPVMDQVLARGAQPGDRVCVFELEASRLGCKAISANDNQQLTLYPISNWQPDVRITPVNSRTVNLQVLNLPVGLSLQARLYDDTGFVSPILALTFSSVSNAYSGTFSLSEPAIEASIHIWVNEADPRREIVANYSLGGNPGHKRSGFGHMRSHFAPLLSGDGQVILYGANLNFAPGAFYVLQTATLIPNQPAWATVVGRGYWLFRSANAPSLIGPSISMSYAQNEVPPGEESFLRVYHWNGTMWAALPTTLATDVNMAVAPAQGPGLYVLLSTIEIPLHGPGWDLLAYPAQSAQPVTQALQAIAGYYSTVYWYNWDDTTDPWKVYGVGAPGWVNDLSTFQFGEVYWISMTQAITLHLKGGGALAADNTSSSLQLPPATFYGQVLDAPDFTPAPGMLVTAWVEGKQCGQGQTLAASGQVVYSINVFAEALGSNLGCGAPGRLVAFKIDGRGCVIKVMWDNSQLKNYPLSPTFRVYLPLLLHDAVDNTS